MSRSPSKMTRLAESTREFAVSRLMEVRQDLEDCSPDEIFLFAFAEGHEDGYDFAVDNGDVADDESAYNEGYECGSEDGYDNGYESGYESGYAEGHDEGYDEARAEYDDDY